MENQTITCPNCGKKIPLTEALYHQIKERIKKEFAEQVEEKEKELEKRKNLLDKEAQKLEDSRKTLEKELEERLKAEKAKLMAEAKKEAMAAIEVDLKDLKEQIAEKEKKLEEAHKAELAIRKKMRELEDQKKSIDLEVARKIDAEREKIRQQALEAFSEEHRLKDLEKDKIISDMRKTIEDLKRKSEQGSIQTQGEVLELDFEELLKTKFITDDISPDKYLSGPEFKQKVEAIVEAFKSMKEDLEQEKRAMLRIWNKREKEIERVITNTVVMYGDLQGIIGTSMPKIKMLELEEKD